jgi:hypothetical protein
MPYLSYITDEKLLQHTKHLLELAYRAKISASRDFAKNVIDPFSPIFEMCAFNIGHSDWKTSELQRQSQKTFSNGLGKFHQNIIASIDGWDDLNNEGVFDVCNGNRKIIAEIKNKHNTVTGSKLIDVYNDLATAVETKNSRFYGYTAFFVNMIPKRPGGQDRPFVPSNNKTGSQPKELESVRIIDGASFFHLATEIADGLQQLHAVLPTVVEEINMKARISPNWKVFSEEDRINIGNYFKDAYG